MAMRNQEAEELLQELAKAGMLNSDVITGIRYQDLQLKERDGKELTVQDVVARVDAGTLRKSEWETFKEIVEDKGGSVDDYSPAFSTRLSNLFEKGGESSFAGTTGGAWATPEGEDTLPEKIKAQGVQQDEARRIRIDYVRTLEKLGYDVDITHLGTSQTHEEMVDRLINEYDIPPEVINGVQDEVEVMAMTRGLTEDEIKERQAEEEAVDATNEENPTYAKNLRAFQLLDAANPTKYQFDKESGAIYLTETGLQVDRRGDAIDQMDPEAAADLVGGWPDDVVKYFDANPLGTGWGKMSAETGIPIDEFGYNDILDVINNKEWYGQDPSRYLMGQPDFLGGFGSGYQVKPEETDVTRRTKATFDTLGGKSAARSALGHYVFDAMEEQTRETRRPWYEPDDNWAQFAGLSPENVAAVQSRLIAVGALDPDEIVNGVWGPAEAAQMQKWMTIANGKAIEWTDVDEGLLKEYFDDETARTTPQRAAFVPEPYRPMDPARVEVTVQDSIRALLGRDATDEDLQSLGGYLTEQYSSSYQADVAAGRSQYAAQVSGDESGAEFVQPGAVQDVDYEARYITEMEKRFEPQLESQQRGTLAGKQQDMGVAMGNLMNRLGGGIG
jgi:hypothetical protein